MAPVETHEQISLLPLATLTGHITLAIVLTLLVVRTIFRSYLALPPSQATRQRELTRRAHVRTFSALAALSLLFAVFWRYELGTLSYQVWAAERGIELPESIFGDKGAFRGGEHPGRLHLARWLADTPIYHDALEIVAEKARRAWWGEQIDLATISWSMLLAIEGRRRNIPHLWAFMLLAQGVSLSFAQNLFYVALLLTPVPLPDNVRDLTRSGITATSSTYSKLRSTALLSKPDNWCPYPIIYLVPLSLSFVVAFLTPFATNTSEFMPIQIVLRVLSYVPLILPYIVSEGWGTVHIHPHNAHSSYTTLFKTAAIAAGMLRGKSTLLALLFNTPDSHYHRHSVLHPFKQERRTIAERTSTAVGKVLGALGDHPAVSAVGWDVILSGLSLGLWAAFRGLDVHNILASSGLYFGGRPDAVIDAMSDNKSVIGEVEEVAEKSIQKIEATPTPGKRRPGRPRKSEYAGSEDGSVASGPTPRRRGRPRKNLEIDSDYKPTEIAQEEGDEDQDEDWEVGALAWGLISLCGLGTGSAGVFGAETTAR